MKVFELQFYLNKVHLTEYWQAESKRHALALCRSNHNGKISKFESVVEVEK